MSWKSLIDDEHVTIKVNKQPDGKHEVIISIDGVEYSRTTLLSLAVEYIMLNDMHKYHMGTGHDFSGRRSRDVCWLCGGRLIWGADFNPEDYGYEGDGIVATLHCSDCGAEVTYVQIHEEEE